jgi:predicted transcriptional regulator
MLIKQSNQYHLAGEGVQIVKKLKKIIDFVEISV